MNFFRKILCKMNFHDDEIFPVEIRPVFIYSNNQHRNLPSFERLKWKCKHCKKEGYV